MLTRIQITVSGVFVNGKHVDQHVPSVAAMFALIASRYHVAAFNITSAGEVFVWI